MRYGLVFLISILLISCKYFDVEKTSSDIILKEELKTFNWEEVETYPSFEACDSTSTKTGKKVCFETLLTKHILASLQKETIVVTQDVYDTLNLEFNISEKGSLTLSDFRVDSTTLVEIPMIKMLIYKSLDSLPPIFPANKRSQPVKTTFTMPVIINVK